MVSCCCCCRRHTDVLHRVSHYHRSQLHRLLHRSVSQSVSQLCVCIYIYIYIYKYDSGDTVVSETFVTTPRSLNITNIRPIDVYYCYCCHSTLHAMCMTCVHTHTGPPCGEQGPLRREADADAYLLHRQRLCADPRGGPAVHGGQPGTHRHTQGLLRPCPALSGSVLYCAVLCCHVQPCCY